MPVQNSPPGKNTRSQISKTFLTPTLRAPLYPIPSVHQLNPNLERGLPMEGAALIRSGGHRSRLGEAEVEEGAPAKAAATEAPEVANQALSNKPLFSQAEPNFLKMMEKITQFMGQLTQTVAPRDN
ncbi:hypothetical protein O181_077712 [Austropuccinia psidii MF-1]|uniref:Uncharacterized protein n=1 Tax=Austropuccinia psidii MF-1 TaxID=1389203 RepID=A0A9Q3FGG8_9BASI|nr:hypothetical protein [Austropuccinia psidii MF-1]